MPIRSGRLGQRPTRTDHLPRPAGIHSARSAHAASSEQVRVSHPHRWAVPPGGRLHRSLARLQASLPSLSGRAGVRRTIPSGAERDRDRGHRAAGQFRRGAHHLWRSRFLQRAGARHPDCGEGASTVAAPDLRCHDQDRASAEVSALAAAAARHRLHVRHQRGRVDRRSRAGDFRQASHARGFLQGRGACSKRPGWCCSPPSSRSIRGRR